MNLPSSDSPSPPGASGAASDSFGRVVLFGVALGLTLGALTLIFEFYSHASAAQRQNYGARHFVPVFVLFAGASAVLYAFFVAIVGRLLRKFYPVDLTAFLAATFCGFLVVWIFVNWREFLYYTPVYQRYRMGFISAFALIAWRLTYIGIKPLREWPRIWRSIAALAQLIPFMALLATCWAWNQKIRLGGAASAVFVAIALAAVVLIAGSALARRVSPRIFPSGALCILALLVCLSPVAEPYVTGRKILGSNSRSADDHPIPRVILLSIDTLRADALGVYSSDARETPHLDALAADSVVFDNAFSSSSWTYPALSSMMTGLSPWTHLTIKISKSLSKEVETLAESLSNAGYFAQAIGSNPLLIPVLNLNQGFADYDFYPRSRPFGTFPTRIFNFLFKGYFRVDANTEELATIAINWIDENARNNFFLWLHFFDPHGPYEPPEEFYPEGIPENFDFTGEGLGRSLVRTQAHWSPSVLEDANYEPSSKKDWIRALYLAEVRYVDDNVGRLVETLKDRGLYEDTLIIVTSDHGEEFWDHGLWGHGHTLYNETIRVPLLIKMPGSAVKGRRDEYVTTQSIAATICELLRIDSPVDQYEAGSLAELLKDKRDAYDEKPIFSMGLLYGKNQESVIVDGNKYSRTADRAERWLFDLKADPPEKISLVTREPELSDSLDQLLNYQVRQARARRRALGLDEGGPDIEMDPQTLEKLRELGYIQ